MPAGKEAFTLASHTQLFFANHSSPQEFFMLLIFVVGGSFVWSFFCWFFFSSPLIVGAVFNP